jgi:hypothetical protein
MTSSCREGGNLKRRIRRAGRITDISNACRYLEGARVEDRLWCCGVLINQSHSEAGSWVFCLIRRGRGGARFATLTACQKQQRRRRPLVKTGERESGIGFRGSRSKLFIYIDWEGPGINARDFGRYGNELIISTSHNLWEQFNMLQLDLAE